MKMPTLSVMMPNYNHARFIPEALDAILSQSYQPLEIVVLDDGSTDDSVEVLERYRRREPDLIRVIRNENNCGVTANANRLLEVARADFVYFAAMDDRVLPGFFERSMSLLSAHPSAGLCSTLSAVMDETGARQGLVRTPVVLGSDGFISSSQVLPLMRRHGNWFMGNTTIYNRSALQASGGFRPELGPYCDGFVSLVIAAQQGVCFVPEPLALWRRMEGTFSERTSASIDAMLAFLREAERLMLAEYAVLFPTSYVKEWKSELYFGAATHAARLLPADQLEQLRRLMPEASGVDRLFYGLAQLVPGFARTIAKPYFFLRLRRHHLWRLLRRRFEHRRLAA